MDTPEHYSTERFYWNSKSTPERQGKDHFVVEDLLDFPNEEEDDDNGVGVGDGACVEEATENSRDSSTITAVNSCNSSFSGEHLAHTGDLCEPDELAELEWLSNFVEESFSSEEDLGKRLQLISSVQSSSSSSSEATSVPVKSSDDAIDPRPAYHFPAKARSKRPRAAQCNWSNRLLVLPPESDTDSIVIDMPKKTPKLSKKKRELGSVGPTLAAPRSDGRRCLHCATEKTPQWRTGPMGPKTLCNACRVRHKSGRLVHEHLPASSPTFVLSRHSNSHRKVLELRLQKEVELQQYRPPLHVGVSVFVDMASPAAAGDELLIHHRLGPDFRQPI